MDTSDSVNSLPFVGPKYQELLEKLGITTIEDLLNHVPFRYEDYQTVKEFTDIEIDQTLTIEGTIEKLINQYTRTGKQMQIIEVSDGQRKISGVWFYQPYLLRSYKMGDRIALSGKIGFFGRRIAILNPQHEKIVEDKVQIHTGRILPIYHETDGISSKWLRRRLKDVYDKITNHNQDIYTLHFPQSFDELTSARERLAYQELYELHIQNLKRKAQWQKNAPSAYQIKNDDLSDFISKLPFSLTDSQLKSIKEITNDLKSEYAMNRLLQGDVGTGKTVVAATACYLTNMDGYQTVLMAPTKILAKQHYDSFREMFSHFGTKIKLITGTDKFDGEQADILIGTHALLNYVEKLKNPALVIIDEQHKFGVKQRENLTKFTTKGQLPNVLTMTATPIPRTIVMTLYGDLELSELTEPPKGRQKITTWVVPNEKRKKAYEWIEKEIQEKKVQVFVVCPIIDESAHETMADVKSVKAQYQKIKKQFPNLKVGLIHGKLKDKEKSTVIEQFEKGTVDILVATPMVEVGINVPNATIMVIEAADRFGLSQLHQLRGRVGRSSKKSYCLLFTESQSKDTLERLEQLSKIHSGAQLAELDLKHRGPGEIFGTRQHGTWKLKFATWDDIPLMKRAKEEAIAKHSKADLQFKKSRLE